MFPPLVCLLIILTPLNIMNNEEQKNIIGRNLAIGIVIVAVFALGGYYFFGGTKIGEISFFEKATVVEETIKIPETVAIVGNEGWFPNKETYKVPLAPKSDEERVIVPGAVLTTKEAYLKAFPVAQGWATDAKLVIVKSLGAVTLDGKSAGWQVVFGSKTKKKGYEVIIEKESVTAQKEIPSSVYGADVPINFSARDSAWAIGRLAENPQWSGATMTGLNFIYSTDGKAWDYVIAHSFGRSTVRVQ